MECWYIFLILIPLNLVCYYSAFRDALKISDMRLVRLIYWTYNMYHIDCIYHSWKGYILPCIFCDWKITKFCFFSVHSFFLMYAGRICCFHYSFFVYVLFLWDYHILNEHHCLFHWWMSVPLVWLFPAVYSNVTEYPYWLHQPEGMRFTSQCQNSSVKIIKWVSKHVWWHFHILHIGMMKAEFGNILSR